MYFVCKFYNSWMLCERSSDIPRSINAAEIENLRRLFPLLLGRQAGLILALEVAPHPLNKIRQLNGEDPNRKSSPKGQEGVGYFIWRVSNILTLYDEKLANGRVITDPEAEFLQLFFPALLGPGENKVEVVKIGVIPLMKLEQLTAVNQGIPAPAKPALEMLSK